MTAKLDCPNCLRSISVANAAAGSNFNCPKCGQRVTVPDKDEAPANYGLANPVVCPSCRKDLPSNTVFCVECGYDFRTGTQRTQKVEEREFRHSSAGETFTFRRDERGKWVLSKSCKRLGLIKTKEQTYDLRRYHLARFVYETAGDDGDAYIIDLVTAAGQLDNIYAGYSEPLKDWFEDMFRNQVGMAVEVG